MLGLVMLSVAALTAVDAATITDVSSANDAMLLQADTGAKKAKETVQQGAEKAADTTRDVGKQLGEQVSGPYRIVLPACNDELPPPDACMMSSGCCLPW